jgi:hypothetical protein
VFDRMAAEVADQTKYLEEAIKKVKEHAFYMKHAMVSGLATVEGHQGHVPTESHVLCRTMRT